MADTDAPPTETVEQEHPDTPPPSPAEPAKIAETTTDPLMERVENISKALQSVTQVVSHIQKKIDGGGELNAVERAKLETANAEAKKLTREIEEYSSRPVEEGESEGIDQKITKALSRQNKLIEDQAKKIEALERSHQAAQPTADELWEKQKAKYPGKDVNKIWKSSLDDAQNTSALKIAKRQKDAGIINDSTYEELLKGAAEELYHARASAKGDDLPVASPPPPNPPKGGRTVPMRGGQQPAPAQHSDPYLALVLATSKKMDEEGSDRV